MSSEPPSPATPATDEPADNGTSRSVATSTTASEPSLPHPQTVAIIPLSATEQAWSKDYCSRVNQLDGSALTYDEDAYGRLQTYRNRFRAQVTIADTDLGRMFDELCVYLDCKPPAPKAMAHYFKEMTTWPQALVVLAFERARRNWTYKKLPLIADFLRWIKDEQAERDELYIAVASAYGRLRIPRRRAVEEAERAAIRAKQSAAADAWLLSLDPAERDEKIRKHLSADIAQRLIDRLSAAK